MDVDFLVGVVRDSIGLLNQRLGTNISDGTAKLIAIVVLTPVVGFTVLFSVKRAITFIRRWSGDKGALDPDGKVVVEHIRNDLRRLQADIRRAAKENANSGLSPLLEVLNNRIAQTEQLVGDQSPEAGEAIPRDRNGRIPRGRMIRLVRETILSNLWSGNYFSESSRRRHVFQTSFPDASGERVAVIVRTPFAAPSETEGEMPYGLDVRHGTRTVLRIQWDPVSYDEIKVRYCIRGSWEDVILSWNVTQAYIPRVSDADELDANIADTAA